MRQPFSYWSVQEVLERDAVTTDEQCTLYLERCRKGFRTGMSLWRAAALHFNGGQS